MNESMNNRTNHTNGKVEENGKKREESNRKNGRFSVRNLVFTALFAAIIACLAQVSIQTPWGIPITLQTFAVALCGYALGKGKGTLATFVYMLVGMVGAPVFAGFKGGFGCILGVTGGFIWGFHFLAFACGFQENFKKNGKLFSILIGVAGLLLCHLCGLVQFSLLTNRTFVESFLLASAPYLIKDVVSVVAAYALAIPLRKYLHLQEAVAPRKPQEV